MVTPAWMSAPSVRLGCTPFRNTAGDRVWSPPLSPGPPGAAILCARLLTTTTWSLNGSRGASVRESLKSAPSPAGVQLAITAPCGMKHMPSRIRGFAAVFASGVCAGTIESSSGSDIAVPMPRKNVRRERCFFVMTLHVAILLNGTLSGAAPAVFIFISNGTLSTVPNNQRRKTDSRERAASWTILRTAGMS